MLELLVFLFVLAAVGSITLAVRMPIYRQPRPPEPRDEDMTRLRERDRRAG